MAETQYNSFAVKWLAYKNKRDKWDLADGYVEKPAMYSQLGSLRGKTILCLGCGSGEECGYFKKRGAEKVIGIDISRKLIHFAKKNIKDCEFKVVNMEKLDFADNSFDIVYSSLAIHYLKNWAKLFSKVNKALKPEGMFLFSIPHPLKWSAESKRSNRGDKASFLLGYSNNKRTGEFHIYGDYLKKRKIVDKWFGGELAVSFYSRPISAIFNDIQKSGFKLLEFLEPAATMEAKKLNPVYWQIRERIPLFIVIKLGKVSE